MSQSSLLIATPNHRHNSGIPCPQEGRWPSSLTLGAGSDGRRLREDEPRGMRTAKSCGPNAPMLASSLAELFREATVARKPGHRGEHEISRKTIAQGRPDCLRFTCMLVCAFSVHQCTRDRGCSAHPV